jgi:hypothetical protein
MTLLRIGLIVACCLGGFGCDEVGGPRRASDIQNLNGISDDISATRMTDSDSRMPHDPNAATTLPKTYETHDSY